MSTSSADPTACLGGEEVAVDWIAGQVLHENDHQFHDWDSAIYGEAGR